MVTNAADPVPLCYVGERYYVPEGLPRFADYDESHPRQYGRVPLPLRDGWTNDVNVVELFPADRVMCCGPKGIKRLDQHADYERWKEEMTTGEMWSMYGEDW